MTEHLGKAGQAVWDAYGAERLDGATQALVRELSRSADVLDKLDGLVRGRQESWASLVFDDMGEVHLEVNKLLDQQAKIQTTFKLIWGELRMSGIKPTSAGTGKTGIGKDEEPEDMLAKLRQEKEKREYQSG